MGIADLFRPKYRHSDVKVRLEAVRAMSSDESDVLATIARTDKDAGVRRVAIEKIDEADVLAELASREDEDRALRDLAGSRASEMWISSACQDDDPALAEAAMSGLLKLRDQRALAEVASRASSKVVRATAQAELKDPRALADLARTTTSPEVRASAIGRIDDLDVLRGIAVDTTHKELGLAAVDKLAGKDVLEAVAQKAKNKAVRQRARKKLDELADVEAAKRPRETDDRLRRRAEKSQVLRGIEAFNETFEWEKSFEAVRTAEQAWAALGDTGDAALDQRFAKAVSRYHQRRDAAARAAVAQTLLADETRARREEARTPEARPPRVREPDPDDRDIVNPVAMAAMKAGLAPRPAMSDEERAARDREAAERREARERERVEDQARQEREVVDRAARSKEAAERGVQIAASLGALVEEMAALFESNDGRAIDRILAQAATGFGQLVKVAPADRGALETRYQEARAKLVIRSKDLREGEDWKRWAAVPRAEGLIAEAKKLAEAEEPPHLNALKDLQARWKHVGALPQKRSQELWEQFKAQADAAFAKIKSGRADEDAKLAENLVVKEQLAAQAEALAESTEWEATALTLKALQKQWKESGPAPRKQADAVWKRFRAACDRFFERRKPLLDAQLAELQENQARKEELIARAEALVAGVSGDDGWGKAIGQVKDLQREWQEIGRVPRAEVEALWQRFRAACDGLFAKRDAARDAEADARRAELEGLRVDIDAVLAGGDDVVGRALAVRRRFAEMTERDVAPSAELRDRLDEMVRVVMTSNVDALKGTELDPAAMTNRRAKLIARAEEMLPKAPKASADGSAADLAAQLKQAMAANSLFKGDGRDPFEVIAELREELRRVGPVVGPEAEADVARFADVCTQVLAAHGGEPEERRDRGERGRGERDRGERNDRDRGGGERRERRERRVDRPVSSGVVVAAAPDAVTAPAPVAVAAAAPVAVAAPAPAPAPVAAPAPAPVAAPVAAPPPAPVDVAAAVPEPTNPEPIVATAPPPPDAPPPAPTAAPEPAPAAGPEVDAVDSGWE